jgi:general nucleoside transport system permease protein
LSAATRLRAVGLGAVAESPGLRAGAWALLTLFALFTVLPALAVSTEDTIIRATPFVLTGLAVALPARAGLVNVGGEGQLLLGTVFATGGALELGDQLTAPVMLPVLAILGALGGVIWAGIAAGLKVVVNLNETISTLLLNFVASLVVLYMVHGPWKDPESFNLPLTADFADSARLPVYGTTQLHLGIVLAVVAVVLVWVALDLTRWGFRVKVVGGNPEAARRAGIPVSRYVIVTLVLGGAFAGLAGMIEVTGIEGRLRPEIAVGFGYIGFLASWLVGHRPVPLVGAALLFGAISVGGDGLQIDAGLPSATVYILMASVLILVLGVRGHGRRTET